MEPLANLNGTTMPLSEVRISAQDRGFLFGDAVYEVLRIYRGKPWLVDEHFRRFDRSLRAISINGVDLGRLRERMIATIAAGKFQEAIAYIQVTRGSAPRAHAFPADAVPLELLYIAEFNDNYRESREQGAGVITHPDLRWERCDIKSTNLLANVFAAQAAKEAGCVEALFYLPDGTLTEASHNSFFGVLDGAVLTTPTGNAILPGITRGLVMSLCSIASIPIRERSLHRADLGHVSELFITGTTSEVLPIVSVDGKSVGNGTPGSVTRRLQVAYQQRVREFLEVRS
jgi:D-alanine transaminase